MAQYILLLAIIFSLTGCGGPAYEGYYSSYPYYGYDYYNYDELYGLPYSYPYPEYYYYSVPTVPAPGFGEEHFERGHGHFEGEEHGRGGGGGFEGGHGGGGRGERGGRR
jgi:hypothetical protein